MTGTSWEWTRDLSFDLLAQKPGCNTTSLGRLIGVPICPDLLDYSALGEADRLRGRVVRGFFWLLRRWR